MYMQLTQISPLLAMRTRTKCQTWTLIYRLRYQQANVKYVFSNCVKLLFMHLQFFLSFLPSCLSLVTFQPMVAVALCLIKPFTFTFTLYFWDRLLVYRAALMPHWCLSSVCLSVCLSVCRLSVTSWYRFETVPCSGFKFQRIVGQGVGSYGAERHSKRRNRF